MYRRSPRLCASTRNPTISVSSGRPAPGHVRVYREPTGSRPSARPNHPAAFSGRCPCPTSHAYAPHTRQCPTCYASAHPRHHRPPHIGPLIFGRTHVRSESPTHVRSESPTAPVLPARPPSPFPPYPPLAPIRILHSRACPLSSAESSLTRPSPNRPHPPPSPRGSHDRQAVSRQLSAISPRPRRPPRPPLRISACTRDPSLPLPSGTWQWPPLERASRGPLRAPPSPAAAYALCPMPYALAGGVTQPASPRPPA